MRHTLLPLRERKNLRQEYYVRLAIVACCMASLVSVAGLVLLLPAYLRAKSEEQRQLDAIALLRLDKSRKTDSAIVDELILDSAVLRILKDSLLQERPSEAIGRIVGLREEVSLNSLSYSAFGTTTASVSIQGIAPTRTSLLSFKERLERIVPGSQIDLPLSELTKSSNLPFSLKVTYPLQ